MLDRNIDGSTHNVKVNGIRRGRVEEAPPGWDSPGETMSWMSPRRLTEQVV